MTNNVNGTNLNSINNQPKEPVKKEKTEEKQPNSIMEPQSKKELIKEGVKLAYEESAPVKISKSIEDFSKNLLEKSQNWGWVKTMQKWFGIKPEK